MMNKQEKYNEASGFNWGKGLAIVIVLFILATLSVVAYIISLDYHMVTENHYEEAVNYQEHIDRVEEASALEKPIKVEYLRKQKIVQITMPESILAEEVEGTVVLYRPSDASKDQRFKLLPDENGTQKIPGTNLLKGKWVVKITWRSGTKNFYKQESIFI